MARSRMKYGVPITLQVTPEMFQHLERKVVRKIRLGEEGPVRACVTEEVRQLIRADMKASEDA